MKITYITDQFLPVDATDTIQLVTMASAFGEVGAEVTLVFPQRPDRPAPPGAIAAYYSVQGCFEAMPISGPYPAPLKLRGLEKLLHAALATGRLGGRANDTDTSAVVYTRNLPVVLAALARTRLPVVYETYRPWPTQSPVKRVLFSALRRHPRLVGLVLHSKLAAESYRGVGFEERRLLVAHNGVDAGRTAEPLPKAVARRELGLDLERPTLLYAGHVSPQKGLHLLLDAAAQLPEVDLVIVGAREDGPIERRAASMSNVRVFPWQPPGAIERWLAAADVLTIPPTRGPLQKFGNTVLPIKTFQYLAAGRPIVAPSTPDLLEVLEDRRNAVLVPPDDLAAYVAALRALFGDAALADRIARAARADGVANTWQGRARRITRFLSERLRADRSAG